MGFVQDHQNVWWINLLVTIPHRSASGSIESPPAQASRDSIVGSQEGTSSRLEPGDLWELLICLLTYLFYMWFTWLGVSSVLSSLNVGQIACGPPT